MITRPGNLRLSTDRRSSKLDARADCFDGSLPQVQADVVIISQYQCRSVQEEVDVTSLQAQRALQLVLLAWGSSL